MALPIDGYALVNKVNQQRITASFGREGGYFFICERAAINSPVMPIITREKEKRFSYVTNCIHKHPLARAKSVTAYRVGSATDALYPSVPSLSTFKLYMLVNFWRLFGVYLVFILVLWGARS